MSSHGTRVVQLEDPGRWGALCPVGSVPQFRGLHLGLGTGSGLALEIGIGVWAGLALEIGIGYGQGLLSLEDRNRGMGFRDRNRGMGFRDRNRGMGFRDRNRGMGRGRRLHSPRSWVPIPRILHPWSHLFSLMRGQPMLPAALAKPHTRLPPLRAHILVSFSKKRCQHSCTCPCARVCAMFSSSCCLGPTPRSACQSPRMCW